MPSIDTKERITFALPAALKKEIEASAAEAGQTLTVWFERASKSYLQLKSKET